MYGKPSIVLLFFAIFKSTTCKDIGDRCSVFHRPGICTVDRECQPFWSMNIQERGAMFQGKCGFQGYRAILCCPITTAKAPAVLVQPVMKKRRKSQEACDSLEERPAKIVPRISGLENSEARNFRIGLRISSAEDAEEGDFPQFAALGYEDNAENRMTSVCGGVLISKNYVLTAAQCLSKQVKLVTLGTIALKAGVNFRAYLRRLEVNVKNQIIHPNYSNQTKVHDLGLVELKTDVTFSFYVWPACLHQGESLQGKSLEIAGFGVTDDLEMMTDLMGKAEVVKVPLRDCSAAFKSVNGKNYRGILTTSIRNGYLCAKSSEKTSNTCKGDEGSGLHLKPKNKATDKRVVVGITSFGNKDNLPQAAVYTRVFQYLDWIESIVWL